MYFSRPLSSLGAAASLLLLLASSPAALLLAQNAPQTDDPPPALPGAPPTIPGTTTGPNGRQPGRLPGNARFNPATVPAAGGTLPGSAIPGEENVRLNYPNSAVTDILDHYGALTGKRVLPDNTIQGTLNIVVNQPVPKSEAIRIIEVALTLNGFTLVPEGETIVKVLGLGKNPRTEGVPIFSDLDQLPDTGQIVSYLVRLRYLDPQETAGALQQYVPPVNRAAFTPLEKAGAIIITDTATSVRRLAGLLAQLDLPSAPVVEKFIRLERADVTKALEFLNTVFDIKGASGTGGATGTPGAVSLPGATSGRRPIRRVGEEGQPIVDQPAPNIGGGGSGLQTLSGDSLIQGRITLTADVRTNRIHVVTAPVNIPLVERLLQEYDANTPFAEPVRIQLRYVSAKDVLPILVQVLAEPGTESSGGTGGTNGGTTGRTTINSNSTASSLGGSGGSNSQYNSSSGYGSNGNSGGSSSSLNDSGLETQAVDTTPTIATVGNTKIIADQGSNTIILLGGAEARDKAYETIRQLDKRPAQVVIRTVIGELSLGQNSELGFNYLLRTNRGSLLSQFNNGFVTGTGTTGTGTTSGTTTTGTTTTTSSTASTLGTLTDLATGVGSGFSGVGGILAIGKSFEIILSALESTSRFKTISSPTIFTSNNKRAQISSGQQIAVPTSQVGSTSGSVAGTVGTYTSVDYKDVLLKLDVRPLVNSESEVTLEIYQQINSLAGSSTVVNGTSIPTIQKRELRNTVSAPNNSTIVLGGLIMQDENRATGDIPYLSRIPVLGNLFRSTTRGANRSELIILMHPEVVNTSELLAQTRQKEERRTYLGSGLEQQLYPNVVKKAVPVQTERVTVKKPTKVYTK